MQQIQWPPGRREEPHSPFERGSTERPIRLTLHRSSFQELAPNDAEALEALSELARLPDVEVLDTSPGDLPWVDIGEVDEIGNQILVRVLDPDIRTIAGIPNADQLRSAAARILGYANARHPEVETVYDDLCVAGAHVSLRQDVLVTISPQLLQSTALPSLRMANPRTPLEAAKLVGLLLRSRDNYTYSAQGMSRQSLDRGLFYLVLCREQLPSMWRYFSTCVHAAQNRQDDTLYLGQSIRSRSVRALQARDAIGFQFYMTQDNNTRDTIMYHFNYLTLLLSGALDAQARIAHRVYGVEGMGERDAYLHRKDFRKALKANGADDLCDILCSPRFWDLDALLRDLRNSIHGAGLPTLGLFDGREQTSFIELLPGYMDKVRRAANRRGGFLQWGLIERGERTWVEPYTYASKLVQECLGLLDSIASATDVVCLFPNGSPLPELPDGPPDDGIYSEAIRMRLSVLG